VDNRIRPLNLMLGRQFDSRVVCVADCDPSVCPNQDPALTPRNAVRLAHELVVVVKSLEMDIAHFGGAPISEANRGRSMILHELPRSSWGMSLDWREELLDAAVFLLGTLIAGELPEPRHPADEALLCLAITGADMRHGEPLETWPGLDELPEYPADDDIMELIGELIGDEDMLMILAGGEFDGLEHPESADNRALRIGDYRPATWFIRFEDRRALVAA
jgi:hypothetical protein